MNRNKTAHFVAISWFYLFPFAALAVGEGLLGYSFEDSAAASVLLLISFLVGGVSGVWMANGLVRLAVGFDLYFLVTSTILMSNVVREYSFLEAVLFVSVHAANLLLGAFFGVIWPNGWEERRELPGGGKSCL